MKQILIISTFFLYLNLFSQEVYVNNNTVYHNGQGEFANLMDNKASVNDITINSDNTFEMWMRPHVSCFTWISFKGIWKKTGDKIEFVDKYDVTESDTYEIYTNENINKYIVTFETDKSVVLKNLKVKINFEYDFDSKINSDISDTFITDKSGKIEIPFVKIPNKDKVASLRFETSYNNRKIYGYLTQNETLNVKKTELPTIMKIVIRENPKQEIITRTVKAISKEDEIRILSVNKTSGKLKDYNKELKLEKIYKKEKQ